MKDRMTNVIEHGRRLACENSKFSVFFDHIEWNDGQEIEDYLVVAPHCNTADLITGVSILPFVGDRLGLIQVYRHAVRDCIWEAPRGFIDEGETALEAAVRELKEETGLSCDIGSLRSLGVIAPEPGLLAARIQLFAALDCVQEKNFVTSEFGHERFHLFETTKVAAMIGSCEIQDPGTLVGYFKLQNFLRQR